MRSGQQRASRLAALAGLNISIVVLAAACGSGADTVGTTSTTVLPSATTTSIPSLLPSDGTIPLANLSNAQRADDLVATAQRALAAWKDAPADCYPSRAEALAARDQFARVATYLAAVRAKARDLSDAGAFKEAISIETDYRTYAATRPFITCKAAANAESSGAASTTTVAGGTTQGLTAGGVAEVPLTVTGKPKVDQEFTISDSGAPCDGLGANTTFLISSQDALGRWSITDVIVDPTGATSANVIPVRAGPAAIEYLAYCGTLDKRHGVVTYKVRPTGDTTTTSPAPTTTDPSAPLVVIDLPTNAKAIVVDPRASEVAIEPETVTSYLAASGAEGGIVVARLNLGDWVALRPGQVSWIPVGPGDEGLETKIVGAKTPIDRTIRVTAPSTTTTSTVAVTTGPTSSIAPVVETPTSSRDNTIWVIGILLALATVSVVLARIRLRR